jgi:DNA-directed RNA polymerase specialized sigma24 family protein
LVPERAARRQEKQILGEALLALTERRPTALELTRFAGLSGREAGDLMGVSEATVNNHVRTAVLQCRLFFRERGAQVAQPL